MSVLVFHLTGAAVNLYHVRSTWLSQDTSSVRTPLHESAFADSVEGCGV